MRAKAHLPLYRAVRAILWREWDPIGVTQKPDWPDDEYDSYAWPLVGKVIQGDEAEAIAAYLDWAVAENMGLSGDRHAHHLDLGGKLIALKSAQGE